MKTKHKEEIIIIQCTRCLTKNRVPAGRLNDHPLCGKCGAPLPGISSPAYPIDVTDQSFEEEVLSFVGPVLMDCWAPWCAPCRTVAPVLDQLAAEYTGRIKVAKLNVDENPMIASRYLIQSIPTMLFFKNGKQIDKLVGAQPKVEIEKHLRPLL
ncbi:MAG: thioredoxin [Deltaproteobacteria bacterium]|nr:thioredoxin [Deltaproteobacteria bacterium]